MMRCESFTLLDHINGRVGRPHANKEVEVIGLYRQLQDLPILLSTLLLDEGVAVLGDTATKHGFTALGTPDQVVDDKGDAVFISLVIHVVITAYSDKYIYNISLEGRRKPWQAPNVWGSIPDACGGLKAVSVKKLVIRLAVLADGLEQLSLTRFRDVVGRFLEGRIEPLAVLVRLLKGTLELTKQYEECGGVLPLKAFLHILGSHHRGIVIRYDMSRHAAHVVQTPGAPPAKHHEGGNEHDIPTQEFGA
jgi:hypothetical protein